MLKNFCFLILFFLFFFELVHLLFLSSYNFQYEISIRKIDLLNDKEGVLRLLPGVGVKKAQEIIEKRKSHQKTLELLEDVKLANKLQNSTEILFK